MQKPRGVVGMLITDRDAHHVEGVFRTLNEVLLQPYLKCCALEFELVLFLQALKNVTESFDVDLVRAASSTK